VTDSALTSTCVVCDRTGAVVIDPPQRTLGRGPDPEDPSFSIIGVLPDVTFCTEHAADFRGSTLSLGWCDDERCRMYGETGRLSPCGEPYTQLKR
jgi:hypothetical protein